MSTNNTYRISNLDVIKIIAAYCIVFHHYQQLSHSTFGYINFYDGVFPFGYLVELFFMISGFLTARSSNIEKGLKKNLCLKIARILPMSFLSVAVCGAILWINYAITGNHLLGVTFGKMQILTSLFLVNGWVVEYNPALNSPIWYLCVLILVEIIYIVLATLTNNNKKTISVIAIGFIVLGFFGMRYNLDYPFLHQGESRGYATFFAGVLIAFIYEKINSKTLCSISVPLLFASIAGIIMIKRIWWTPLVFCIYPLLVVSAITLPHINSKVLSFWGGVTFEIYLWHVPTFCFFKMIVEANNIAVSHSYLTMLLFSLFVTIISVASYKYIELPINRKLKQVINRLN